MGAGVLICLYACLTVLDTVVIGINTSSLFSVFVQTEVTYSNNKICTQPLLCRHGGVFKAWLHSSVANNRPRVQKGTFSEGSAHMHAHTEKQPVIVHVLLYTFCAKVRIWV